MKVKKPLCMADLSSACKIFAERHVFNQISFSLIEQVKKSIRFLWDKENEH